MGEVTDQCLRHARRGRRGLAWRRWSALALFGSAVLPHLAGCGRVEHENADGAPPQDAAPDQNRDGDPAPIGSASGVGGTSTGGASTDGQPPDGGSGHSSVDCDDGEFESPVDGASTCIPWTECPAGYEELATGSATSDRVCQTTGPFALQLHDRITAVTVDGSGNVYVTGTSFLESPERPPPRGTEAFVYKYDSAGNTLWLTRFGTNEDDSASTVNVNGDGAVFVTGSTLGAFPTQTNGGQFDAFVAKFDASGGSIWTRQFGSLALDRPASASLDAIGNLTLGVSIGWFGGSTVVVKKFDTSGVELWSRSVASSPYDGTNVPTTSDTAGNVYVASASDWLSPPHSLADGSSFLRKYDSSGTELWTHEVGPKIPNSERDLGTDSAGNSYAVGGTHDPGTEAPTLDAFLMKYDSAGTALWSRELASSAEDVFSSLAFDADGNVYVAGYTYESPPDGQNESAFVKKYDGAGTALWTYDVDTTWSLTDLAVGPSGAVYLAAGARLLVIRSVETTP